MSVKHPIISVTGSSGAGTTSVKTTFKRIFNRETVNAASSMAMHSIAMTAQMKRVMAEEAEREINHFSHFGPECQPAGGTGRVYSGISAKPEPEKPGTTCTTRKKRTCTARPGTFSAWEDIDPEYRIIVLRRTAWRGGDRRRQPGAALRPKIGVVPVVNLEWIQKIHRDKMDRGYSTQAIKDTILRRMPDYLDYICPQFSQTDINFPARADRRYIERLCARWIPTPDESMVVIRFRQSQGYRFPLPDLDDSRQLHVPGQFHRDSGRQDGPGHATDPDPHDHAIMERSRRAGGPRKNIQAIQKSA